MLDNKPTLIDRLREFFCTHKYDTHSASSLQVFEFDLCNGLNWEEIYIALNTLTAEGLLTKTQDQEDGEFSYYLADTPGPCAVSCSEILKLQVENRRLKNKLSETEAKLTRCLEWIQALGDYHFCKTMPCDACSALCAHRRAQLLTNLVDADNVLDPSNQEK